MIPAQLYYSVFLYMVILMTMISSYAINGKSYNQIIHDKSQMFIAVIVSIIFVLWLGDRPISAIFGDTDNYARFFYLMQHGLEPSETGEWMWNKFMYICSQTMDVHSYFTIIEIGYFAATLWACKRLMPNNTLFALLFNLGSLSFYSYGVNGIRNGLACAIVILILSYACGKKKDLIIAGLLSIVAINIHRTTILPIGMAALSLGVIKSFKSAYTFWILSILISLVAGGAITSFFAGLGFDDRLSYLTTYNAEKFSRSGFRWDFLLYSMMPIVLGYYIVIKRGIEDKTYQLLLNTYTLANAFWVMVIRANFSNRFAYLSWFLYPVVLAYPLFRLNIWGDIQGKYVCGIAMAHIGFTWFMSVIYW